MTAIKAVHAATSTTGPDSTEIAQPWRSVAGRLHSWDISTGVDGPGTRFVAFLAGCPLRYSSEPRNWGCTPP